MSPPREHGQLALDLETVSLVDDPNFGAPKDWRIFAIALAYRADPHSDITTMVRFRETESPTAGQILLMDVFEWVKTHASAGDTLLTYNGDYYDLPIIREATHTCDVIEGPPGVPSLASQWEVITDLLSHRDLFIEAREQRPDAKYPSLTEACESRDIRTVTPRLDGQVIEGADMCWIGEQIMDATRETDRERGAVREYATQDVEVLFPLADALTNQELIA